MYLKFRISIFKRFFHIYFCVHKTRRNNNNNNNNNNWRLKETRCHSDSSEKPSANADVKSSNEWIIIIIIIISECSKLAQKEYKTRHNWVGKVIHWEMCKKFKFDHTNKWYMHNPAPVLENDTHKLLWDFDIWTDHLISTRRPDLIIINKKREFAKLSTLLSRLTTE